MKIKPPEDIKDISLDEWNRIVKAIEDLGRELKAADRSLLALYCRLWNVNQTCYAHVQQFGPIIKYANGVPGASPQYKSFIETSKQLATLLAALGCTPEVRKFDVVKNVEEAEMEITY